ncbi:PAS domain S-box protein [Rufibacter soli]
MKSLSEEPFEIPKDGYYKLLFESNPLPMWVFNTQTLRFVMVNAAAVSLYGYSEEEFTQMTIKDVRQKCHLPRLLEVVSKERGTLSQAGEWEHRKKDGTLLQVEVHSHALEMPGKKDYRLVVVHDLTAKKLAEKQLLELESRAQSILNNIASIIFSFNSNMEMIYVSPQCETILGYTPDEFYADKNLWFDLVHPLDQHLFKEALPKLKVSSDQFQVEYRIKTKTGEDKWLIARCSSKLDEHGNMQRLDGSSNDITLRKRTEEKLKFADLSIEHAAEAFLWARVDGRILRVNKAAIALLGYTEEELLALTIFEVAPSLSRNAWDRQSTGEEPLAYKTIEINLRAKAGQEHPVEMHFNLFGFEQENFSFISIRQIKDRKQAEAEKLSLTEEMARQNEHLRQFAYIVSHNLRAPVANIMGLTSLYNRRNLLDPVNPVLINKLERTSHKLDSTIRDLNEILTIRSKVDQPLEEVDLQEVLQDVQESVALQLYHASSKLSVDFSAGRKVLAYKGYVHSILLNLITNAIKYRRQDCSLQIGIKTVFSNEFLCLQIQDNGTGIDLGKQGSKVFGLYRRFHPHIEGKGLGLYMIKTQIETIGGWVDVDSEVGQGSTFKVFFKYPLTHE